MHVVYNTWRISGTFYSLSGMATITLQTVTSPVSESIGSIMACAMITFPQGVTELGCDVTVWFNVTGYTAGTIHSAYSTCIFTIPELKTCQDIFFSLR